MIRYSILASVLFALVSCASAPQKYPALDQSRLVDVVAIVELQGGHYFPEDPTCNKTVGDEIIICMDPPPFEMHAEVVQQFLGPRLPPRIDFVSTSHYGMPRDRLGELRIVHLQTDGKSIVMPRYHSEVLGEDYQGGLAVPVRGNANIYWLPCGTSALAKPVSFQFLPRDHRLVGPQPAIAIDTLERFLKERRPLAHDAFGCDS
jgi:hypothetical protein